VHRTGGICPDLQAFFWLRAFPTSQTFSTPAPPSLTQTVEIVDLTSIVRRVWEQRRQTIPPLEERKGYNYLLDDPNFELGEAIFYIDVRGKKP